jgi:hypothetical protein
MVTLVRIGRIAVLLVLAVAAVSLLIGMFRPETGGVEKAALAGMFATCVVASWAVTRAAARLRR